MTALVLLALVTGGVALWWLCRRARTRVVDPDYMPTWRTFSERDFPLIHPAHLPPLEPLKAKRVE